MATLDQLSPAYQAQYDALLPQLKLQVQQANQARGMFYSGQATDAETKAEADLLAKLAAQQATDQQQQLLQANQINQAQSAQENQSKATARATNMGLIGSGIGAAATLGGLAYMNKGGANGLQNIVAGGPTGYMQLKNGTMTPVPMAGGAAPGVGGSALAAPAAGATPAGVGGLDGLAGVGPTPSPAGPGAFNAPGGANGMGGFNPGGAAPAAATASPTAAPVASMWNNPLQGAEGVGMGLAGGVGGYLAANQVNGGGRNTPLAAGLGGLAGAGAGALMSSGNPYAAGAGALLGSFGGGLLGNLFK